MDEKIIKRFVQNLYGVKDEDEAEIEISKYLKEYFRISFKDDDYNIFDFRFIKEEEININKKYNIYYVEEESSFKEEADLLVYIINEEKDIAVIQYNNKEELYEIFHKEKDHSYLAKRLIKEKDEEIIFDVVERIEKFLKKRLHRLLNKQKNEKTFSEINELKKELESWSDIENKTKNN